MILSGEDFDLAQHIAEMRNVNEKHFGAMTYGEYDSLTTHLIGAMGEIIVARHFGVEPDTVFSDKGGGGTFDNEIQGHSIEVKTQPQEARDGRIKPAHLYVRTKGFKNADLYYKCVANHRWGLAMIVGYATGEDVANAEVANKGDSNPLPPSYIIREEDLRECDQGDPSQ